MNDVPPLSCVAILGIGLIGSSLARVIRARGLARRILPARIAGPLLERRAELRYLTVWIVVAYFGFTLLVPAVSYSLDRLALHSAVGTMRTADFIAAWRMHDLLHLRKVPDQDGRPLRGAADRQRGDFRIDLGAGSDGRAVDGDGGYGDTGGHLHGGQQGIDAVEGCVDGDTDHG